MNTVTLYPKRSLRSARSRGVSLLAAMIMAGTVIPIAAFIPHMPALAVPTHDNQQLEPGADLSDCESALRLGPQVCMESGPTASNGDTHAHAGQEPSMVPQGLEEQIDAFLANYGKPPREAVRALLDPSDGNIRALLRLQREKLAIVAYVAGRMTDIQAGDGDLPASGSASSSVRQDAFRQMRIWLVQRARDPEAAQAMHALRDLNHDFPGLQAGVRIAGRFAAQQLRAEIAQIDPPLSVDVVTPESVETLQLPFLRIEDLRSHRTVEFDARSLGEEQIRQQLIALRPDGREPAAPWLPSHDVPDAPQ